MAVAVDAVGGGRAAEVTGTAGARLSGVLHVQVGSAGGPCCRATFNGGGSFTGTACQGGGAADVRTCSSGDGACGAIGFAADRRLLVAAGGGGEGRASGGAERWRWEDDRDAAAARMRCLRAQGGAASPQSHSPSVAWE